MWFLKDLPIRRKLARIILVTCGSALLLTVATLFAFQTFIFRKSHTTDLLAVGEMIADTSTAAISFKDHDSARGILVSLKAKPHIVGACIYQTDGSVLAQHGRDIGYRPNRGDGDTITRFGPYLVLSKPVLEGRKPIGMLCIWSDYANEFRRLLALYAGILGLVLVASLLLGYLFSKPMRRLISEPILRLADAATTIARKGDYSVRAGKLHDDELGQLTDAFNRMLDQIESQNRALKESRERFEVAVMGSNDGLWDWNLRTGLVYLSPRWKSMIGYEETELGSDFQTIEALLHPEDREPTLRRLKNYLDGRHPAFEAEFRLRQKDGSYRWVLSRGAALLDEQGKPFRMAGSQTDISKRKEAEAELAKLNQQLYDSSHKAGMAEVATGVLHNVGNVLTSVNVSATLLKERLDKSHTTSLNKTAELLKPHMANPGEFFTSHPKGRLIPEYLVKLADCLATERREMQEEVELLARNIEHIKEIVAMQQSYARIGGVSETLPPAQLVEDAFRLNEIALARHEIKVARQFSDVPRVVVDKHKVLQILMNLITNAKHAMEQNPKADRRLVLGIAARNNRFVQVSVADNGAGIAPENLTRVFNHGFTTKKDGHGFGLHSGANAANEMGGTLIAKSDGLGRGATFVLELPTEVKKDPHATGRTADSVTGEPHRISAPAAPLNRDI